MRILKKIVFKISNTLYKNSQNLENFDLKNISTRSGIKELKKNKKNLEIIKKYLIKYSNISQNFSNNDHVYYLQESKKYIYEAILSNEENFKMSLSTFYKYCPKNFKRPTKETDKCTICEIGKKLQKKEELNINEINYFKYYENHRKCVQNQKENLKN